MIRYVLATTLGAATLVAAFAFAAPPLPSVASEVPAVVGRPLTPISYAGVARRTTRRAVYAGAATSPYW